MVSGSPEYSAVASPVAEAAARQPGAVEYPGHWHAQSVWQGVVVKLATDARTHGRLRNLDNVLVAMELVVYYERGDNQVRLQPDVQVVFGVGCGGNCCTYNVLEEGKAPDFVLEVASPSTAENNGATVLVIRDRLTGEEIHRPLEASERQWRLAEEQLVVARDEARAARYEATAAEK